MSVGLFGTNRKQVRRNRRNRLRPVTLRDFGGGLNRIDSDLNLSTKYSIRLENWHKREDGRNVLRYGTAWFADFDGTVTGTGVDAEYFIDRLIIVTTTGQIVAIDKDGNKTAIWNSTIAAALPGAPSGWSTTTRVSFVPFRNKLVIHNGVDKPIEIDSSYAVTYLQDPSTGSNVNTPIGSMGTAVGNYHVVAGISAAPTTIYISSSGTSGVFPGDPDPNDAISLDVGAYSPQESDEIRAVKGFRQFLLVMFRGSTLVITLGSYDSDGNHVPDIQDTLPRYGSISQRIVQSIENDIIFADSIGVNTASRQIFTSAIESERVSELISPDIQAVIATLTDDQQRDDCFALYNRLDSQYMLFLPNGNIFVMTFGTGLRNKTWSTYTGWSWTGGAVSTLGRTFFLEGTRVYQLGNRAYDEAYHADKLNDRDGEWANSTAYSVNDIIWDTVLEKSYKCLFAHTSPSTGQFHQDRNNNPLYWEEYLGEEISFNWEFPWIAGSDRMSFKTMRHIMIDSHGDAEFNLNCYVDRLYKDGQGNIDFTPQLSLTLVAGDSPGFGGGEQPFGGGRRTYNQRLWSAPCKFKLIKFQITGSTRKPFEFVGLSFTVASGSMKRT